MPPSTTGSSISERARNGTAAGVDAQDGLFDKEITDTGLESLLDERETKKTAKARAVKAFKEKDDLVKARLGEFELADGEVARVGKYRIENKPRRGGHRSFDVSAGNTLSITLFDGGE
jgi:hypothetical protein